MMLPATKTTELSRAAAIHMPPIERFLTGFVVNEAGCWVWQRSSKNGYGVMKVNYRQWRTHRWAYEHFTGPIADGLVVDHLCENKLCCNPEHLEPVTPRENTLRSKNTLAGINARKPACPRCGLQYTQVGPSRICVPCRRQSHREYRLRTRAAA